MVSWCSAGSPELFLRATWWSRSSTSWSFLVVVVCGHPGGVGGSVVLVVAVVMAVLLLYLLSVMHAIIVDSDFYCAFLNCRALSRPELIEAMLCRLPPQQNWSSASQSQEHLALKLSPSPWPKAPSIRTRKASRLDKPGTRTWHLQQRSWMRSFLSAACC